MRFSDIVQNLQIPADQHSLTSHPDSDPELTALASVEDAAPSTFSYIDGSPNERYVAKTEASALVLPVNTELQQQASDRGIAWIATSQPKLVFAQAIRLFYQPFHPEPEIHPTAVIHPSAQIGKEVYIGPHVVIQADVTLGDRVCIHPNVTIYPGVQIGDRTLLHANCVIHERTRIGADCVIHSGAVLGSEGFGFVPTATGWFKMEQTGCTILEDGVEVGCNSTIDRAAIGETRIGRNTKIDNMVHIAHGCKVGEACAFAGQVGMAGSVTIGNRVIFAGQVGVANQARVGDGVIVTAKSGIHSDVRPGEIVSGYPPMPHKTYLKFAAMLQRVPEMYQWMRQMQRQMSQQDEKKG